MKNKNVDIGNGSSIGEYVILGKQPRGKSAKLVIGDNATIREFTVIYGGSVIGKNLQTGHHVVIREDNKLGNYVSVGSGSELGPGNKIGDRVRIHSQCFLEHVNIGNNVFIAPGVKFGDDPHPYCPRWKECILGAKVGDDVSIGIGAVILPGIKIGKGAVIGAGSIVTKDVPENKVVVGNPAKVIKDVDELKCFKGFYKKPYEWRGHFRNGYPVENE